MPSRVRSFAEEIRARSDAELAQLLLRRPDLVRPAPADLSALAGRAATRASVARALDRLDTQSLRVLEAHIVASALGCPPGSLLRMTEEEFEDAARELWATGLLWQEGAGGDANDLRPLRSVVEALPHPAHLGRPASELGLELPDDLPGTLGGLSGAAHGILDRTKWTHWRIAAASEAVGNALDELVSARVAARDGDTVVVPCEVGLAMRSGVIAEGVAGPAVPLTAREPALVDSAGAAEAAEIVWAVGEVLRRIASDPPRVMRAGGLAVRDHKIVAGWLDAELDRAAFVLEIAAAAGLLASDGEVDPSWLPTSSYDEWLGLDVADRWARLAQAWWRTLRAPSLAGARGPDGGIINVLGPDASWPLMRGRRESVLQVLAALDPGTSADPDAVETLVRWRHPIRLAGDVPTHSVEILREADWLGVTGRGALTGAGRLLVDGEPGADLADALRPHLPAAIDHVLLQADLTAIAPGPLTPDLDALMHQLADVESRGGATVFRFTDTSLRRGLDTGRSADDLRAALARASLTPMPQPLDYLIGDAARRHGQTRVGSVASYLRSDDSTLLEALLAEPALRLLQLRRIAPTVLVSPTPTPTLVERIREAGHGAVVETSDGGVVIETQEHRRAPQPPVAPTVHLQTLGADDAATLVTQLRSREDAARTAADRDGPVRIPTTDPSLTVSMLLDAAAEGAAVWIGHVDGSTGQVTGPKRLLVRPREVTGGRLLADVDGQPRTQSFAIHRITGVAQA